MMSPQVMQSWYTMVTVTSILGIMDQFFNLLGGMLVFLLYITISILGKFGFPVWENSFNSWNLPNPSAFGYGAGISLWFILLYVLAELRTPPKNKT